MSSMARTAFFLLLLAAVLLGRTRPCCGEGRIPEHAAQEVSREREGLPPDADTWLKSFVALNQQGKNEEAAAVFEKLIALSDKLRLEGDIAKATRLHLGMANALGAVGRLREAVQVAKAILESDPRNAEAVTVCARAFLESGAFDEAERMLKAALRGLAPKSGTFHSLLGRSYYGRYRIDADRELLVRAASELELGLRYGCGPDEGFTAALLAETYAHLGERDKALNLLSRLTSKEGGPPTVGLADWYTFQMNTFWALEDWGRAIEFGERLIKLDLPPKQRAEVYLALGGYYNKKGAPEKALEYVKKVLEAKDIGGAFLSAAHAVSSNCYRNLGRWKDCIREAERCLAIPGQRRDLYQMAYLDLAYCYRQLRKLAEAREALEKGISIDPSSEIAKAAAKELEDLERKAKPPGEQQRQE